MKKLIYLILIQLPFLTTNGQTTVHGIDANWYQTPKVAVTSGTSDLQGAVANNVVVKNNGTVIIFYRQGPLNKWIQSIDNGNTWTSPGALYAPAATSGMSSISADIDQSDNIYIVWKSGHFSIGFAKYNGSAWTNTTINTQTQTGSDTVKFSQITVDRLGRIHIMWQQGDHQNYGSGVKADCWYARSTDGGSTFTSSLLSQGNNYHAAFPVSDLGGTSHDTIMIAWRENVNGCASTNPSTCSPNGWNWDVKGRISYDGGVNWNPVFTVQGSGMNDADDDQWDPNVTVDRNGVLHVFYHVYHNNTFPDLNANIMYKYSLDGGTTWQGPTQLSTTNIRSHLIKTAYDYSNNYVWCTWKDELDFGLLPNNTQADIKTVYINNTGTPAISAQEFITDHHSGEVALHNFKVGNDGIMRATYSIAKSGGTDTLFYTQRASLTIGLEEINPGTLIYLYPNPTNDIIKIHNLKASELKYILYDVYGKKILSDELKNQDSINLGSLNAGIYFLIIKGVGQVTTRKIIKL